MKHIIFLLLIFPNTIFPSEDQHFIRSPNNPTLLDLLFTSQAKLLLKKERKKNISNFYQPTKLSLYLEEIEIDKEKTTI